MMGYFLNQVNFKTLNGPHQIGDHGRGAPEQPQLLDGCLVGDVGHDGDGALVQRQPEVGVRSVQHRGPVRHHGEGLDEGDGELPDENKTR